MLVLYIGARSGTSLQRAKALVRLGHEVEHVSPYDALPRIWGQYLNRLGGLGLDTLVARFLKRSLGDKRYEIALVDSGDVIGPSALAVIRAASPLTANYNADNPYCDPPAERKRWTLMRRALPGYDLCVAVRRVGLEEQMRARSVRRSMLIWQCADEVVHQPVALTDENRERWASDVVFVGTWMPGRDDFFAGLLERGIKLRVYGPRWHRAPNYNRMAHAVSPEYLAGDDYTKAIAGAKIALVLLNPANHDLHTTRTAEIPAIGTAMIAPRTPHHLELFKEGEEALFFDDEEECAVQCHRLLNDDNLRRSVAAAGHARSIANGTYNEVLMRNILDELQATGGMN